MADQRPILIADHDHKHNIQLSEALEKAGYHVKCVHNLEELIIEVEGRLYPLIFFQAGFYHKDLLKIIGKYRTFVWIALSDKYDEKLLERLLEAKVCQIQFKPISMHTAVSVVKTCLRVQEEKALLNRQVSILDKEVKQLYLDYHEKIHEVEENANALHESQLNHRMLFNLASDMILLQDENYHFIDVNDYACKRLGYTRDELMTIDYAQLVGQEYKIKIEERRKRLRKEGVVIYDTRYVTKNGESVYFESSSRVIDYNGQKALLSIERDVSYRKEIENELVEYENQILRLIDGFPEIVFETDEEGCITFANDYAYQATGFGREVMGQVNFMDLIVKAHEKETARKEFAEMMKGHRSYADITYQLEVPGKKKFFARVHSQPKFSKGRFVGIRGFALEVEDPEKKQQIIENADRMRELAEMSPCILFETDAEDQIIYINKYGRNKLSIEGDYTEKGIRDTDLIEDKHLEGYTAYKESLGKQRESYSIEIELNNKYGANTFYLLSAHEVMKDGKKIGFRAAMLDISMRKAVENELLMAKEQAIHATREKSRFLAIMSHEIRTPLNAIMGLIRLMEKTPINQQQERYFNLMKSASASLLSLIQETLDISRIEEGRTDLDVHEFNLGALMQNIKENYRIRAKDEGLRFRMDIAENFHQTNLAGDKARITQVINNLISNAIKYTNKGQVTVSTELEEIKGKDVLLNMKVKDTGIGIPKEKLGFIFESYSQLQPNNNGKMGSGLGLSICKKIVRLMNGTIRVESEPGKGSIFSIGIPLQTTQKSKETETKTHKAPQIPKGLLVLVVEDDMVNREFMTELLNQNKIEHHMAGNGLEAIDRYKENDYDLILMDIHMPVMDGKEATKQIRAMEKEKQKPHAPIIALTADAVGTQQHELMAIGFDQVIIKPLSEEKIESLYQALSVKKKGNKKPLMGKSHLNRTGLKNSFEKINPKAQKRILAVLEQFVPENIAKAKSLLKEGRPEAMKKQLHKLKGELRIVSADKSIATIQEIEETAGKAPKKETKALLKQLENECSIFLKELKAFVHEEPDK